MTTIVVVGLLPAHVQHLKRKVRYAEVRCVEARGDRARIPKADHCILLIGNVRHLWTDAAFEQFDRNNVHYCRGGVSHVLRTIESIIKGCKPKETVCEK